MILNKVLQAASQNSKPNVRKLILQAAWKDFQFPSFSHRVHMSNQMRLEEFRSLSLGPTFLQAYGKAHSTYQSWGGGYSSLVATSSQFQMNIPKLYSHIICTMHHIAPSFLINYVSYNGKWNLGNSFDISGCKWDLFFAQVYEGSVTLSPLAHHFWCGGYCWPIPKHGAAPDSGYQLPKSPVTCFFSEGDTLQKSPDMEHQMCPKETTTIWLFNIAMENHHF